MNVKYEIAVTDGTKYEVIGNDVTVARGVLHIWNDEGENVFSFVAAGIATMESTLTKEADAATVVVGELANGGEANQ